jgi:hypothetical protein
MPTGLIFDSGGGSRISETLTAIGAKEAAMAAIEITRKDLTARELRAASAKVRDAKMARRMPAIALVLEGKTARLRGLKTARLRGGPAG